MLKIKPITWLSNFIPYGFVGIILATLASLFWYAINGDTSHWHNLIQYVLPQASINTLILLFGVGVIVMIIGTGCAWLTSAYDFFGKKQLRWALLLPLAVPTYIIAFAYLDIFHPIGPLQTFIRELLGYQSPREFRLPDIRSMWGAVFLLGFILYPYVYLSTKVMFMTQAANLLEAARILGCNQSQAFFRVILPLARPAIVVGLSLALLETLNDIGASEFLGIQTLTVSIYSTWVTRNNLAGAAQIALCMLIVVCLIIAGEQFARRKQRYHGSSQRMRSIQAKPLSGFKSFLAFCLGFFPVLIGFIIPVLYLISETIKRFEQEQAVSSSLIQSLFNTISTSMLATVLTLAIGLLIVWKNRPSLHQNKAQSAITKRLGSLGYAIPGTVLALGLLIPYALIDNFLSGLLNTLFNAEPRLYIMGSITALVWAYVIRFMAISIGNIDSGLNRLPNSLEYASRILGRNSSQTLRKIHLPLLRPAFAAAGLLIFVDAMKELSSTLLLRPLNFETLATLLYAEASRGTYEEGAIAALAIVLAGLFPVIFLARTQLKSHY